MNIKAPIAVGAYAAAIVAANVITNNFGVVPVGFGLFAVAGTYAAGFALLARDFVHKYAGARWAVGGVIFGAFGSWFLASPTLALASAAAFLVAELVDLLVYTRVRRRGFIKAASISNLVSAPLDTVVFLLIAGFPLTLETLTGQMVGKLLWATAVPLFIYWTVSRALLRESVHPKSA